MCVQTVVVLLNISETDGHRKKFVDQSCRELQKTISGKIGFELDVQGHFKIVFF